MECTFQQPSPHMAQQFVSMLMAGSQYFTHMASLANSADSTVISCISEDGSTPSYTPSDDAMAVDDAMHITHNVDSSPSASDASSCDKIRSTKLLSVAKPVVVMTNDETRALDAISSGKSETARHCRFGPRGLDRARAIASVVTAYDIYILQDKVSLDYDKYMYDEIMAYHHGWCQRLLKDLGVTDVNAIQPQGHVPTDDPMSQDNCLHALHNENFPPHRASLPLTIDGTCVSAQPQWPTMDELYYVHGGSARPICAADVFIAVHYRRLQPVAALCLHQQAAVATELLPLGCQRPKDNIWHLMAQIVEPSWCHQFGSKKKRFSPTFRYEESRCSAVVAQCRQLAREYNAWYRCWHPQSTEIQRVSDAQFWFVLTVTLKNPTCPAPLVMIDLEIQKQTEDQSYTMQPSVQYDAMTTLPGECL